MVGSPPAPRRAERIVRLAALAAVAVAAIVVILTLPLAPLLGAAERALANAGPEAALLFIAAFAVGTVLLLPGSIFTLAAGAVFGLGWGTVVASAGATLGAALAFLVSRHVARGPVQRLARRRRWLAALDRVLGEEGWKVVALLRLSPVVPFNLQNYLYGITSIRFWPYVLVSWLFMLPGTFLYAYLGWIGRSGLTEAAAGAGSGASAGVWALRIVGLLATLAAAVFLTRSARRRLGEQPELGGLADVPTERPRRPVTTALAGLAGLAAVALAVVVLADREAFRARIAGALGLPPPTTMRETYAENPSGPRFDHGTFDGVLREVVDARGFVDYARLAAEPEALDRYLAELADAPLDAFDRDERLAMLINAYNAFTLKLILDWRGRIPLGSIKDIPARERWEARRWRLGGRLWSLNELEHAELRVHFVEPRVHFALVCAAAGCPPLRREAYSGARIEAQLEAQTRMVHGDPRWARLDPARGELHLTELYAWYRGDFVQVAGDPLRFAARYVPGLEVALESGRRPEVRWIPYDWSLNDQAALPPARGPADLDRG